MPYKTLDEVNTSEGIHTVFTYVTEVVPIFTPMLLFGIFLIAMLGSYFSITRIKGEASFPSSFAVAGFLTALIATFMSFIPDLINITTLVVTYAVAILGFLWLVLDNR